MTRQATRAGTRRSSLVAALGSLVVASAVTVSAAPAHATAAAGRAAVTDPTVVLLGPARVRAEPRHTAPTLTVVAGRRPLTDVRTVLPVVATETDVDGRRWLRVRLPGRTLGSEPPPASGWILDRRTRRDATPWRIVVDLGTRRVAVMHRGVPVRSFRAIVGASSTPTPRGRFLVEENVRLPPERAGAPFALATSARSNVLQEFDGGPGQIALHGRHGLGGRLGTATSHGCVRLSDGAISWIAARVGPGARVTIE